MSTPGTDDAAERAAPAGGNEPPPASEMPGGAADGAACARATGGATGAGPPGANGSGPNEEAGQRAWNGGNAHGPADSRGEADGTPEAANDAGVSEPAEESLDGRYDERESAWSWVRSDFPGRGSPGFAFGPDTNVGNIAGRRRQQLQHLRWLGEARSRGPIGTTYLALAAQVHVGTRSDPRLAETCREDHLVFLRGRSESGRRSSAVVVLDWLTGRDREESRVTVLDAAAGLGGLADRLVRGRGHLVDAVERGLDRGGQ